MSADISDLVGKGYTKLAYWAQMRGPEHSQNFINFVLNGMHYGSTEAHRLFPCLMNISKLGTDHKDIFLREVSLWKYLISLEKCVWNVEVFLSIYLFFENIIRIKIFIVMST